MMHKAYLATLVMDDGSPISLGYENLSQLRDRLEAQRCLNGVADDSPVFYFDPVEEFTVRSTYDKALKVLKLQTPHSTEDVAQVKQDAERWRVFAGSALLMVTDFETHVAGTFRTTKEQVVDGLIEKQKRKMASVTGQAAPRNASGG